MPKQLLEGSLDDQSEFLYDMALEKMQKGNFTGAYHALKEVVKHNPGFRDAPALLERVKRHKAEQRFLLLFAFMGSALFIAIGSTLRLSNDLLFILLAIVGLLIGYGAGNFVNSFRRS